MWGLAAVGALAILVLIAWGGFVVWTLRTSGNLPALAVTTPTVQPVPTFTPTTAANAALPLVTSAPPTQVLPGPDATPVAPPSAAPADPTPQPITPTPVLEAPLPTPPPFPTFGLDDIAPGGNDSPPPTPAPPTPTATPPPTLDAQLAQAIRLHRLGDFVAARSRLAAIIADAATVRRDRIQARLFLVKGYLAEGFYGEALAALDALQTELATAQAPDADLPLPPPEFQAQTNLLRGLTLAGLGRGAEAVAAYDLALAAQPALAAAVQPWRARILQRLGDSGGAAAAYRAAADAATDTVQKVALLELLAQTHSGAGRYAQAVAAYDEILGVARNAPYRAQILYRAGETLALAGDLTNAIARWRAATDEAPAHSFGYQSLVRLVEQQVEFDLIKRGQINLAAQSWQPAVNAFTNFLNGAAADDPRAGTALHGLGLAYLGLGDAAAARTRFERVLADYPQCDCRSQVWLDLARAQAALGDGPGARRTYRTFARDFPTDPLAAEALWRSGLLALNEGSNVEGAVDLLALVDAFPTSERAPQALYTVGFGAYANGLYVESADAFTRLAAAYPDYRWDATGYWRGRALRARGDLDGARTAWQAVVNRAPDIYFGILSAQALRGFGTTQGAMLANVAAVAGPPSRVAGDDGSRAFAEAWLAQWLGSAPPPLPVAVTTDPDWVAGRLLLAVDERGDGLAALERVYMRHRDAHATLYALSLAFEEMGAYRLSLISMVRLLQFSPARLVENAPRFLQERAYPRRFDELITGEAQAHGIPPLVMFSLVRQESLFEEGARSVAAAQGLAQIIPDTGAWVAQRLQYPNYTNDLVYRPHINIKFGAYYLQWVRNYLDGNLVSALVGYNAGPGNSNTWRRNFGADDTLFVERLTFSEPRAYIYAILSNVYHYTRLYGE